SPERSWNRARPWPCLVPSVWDECRSRQALDLLSLPRAKAPSLLRRTFRRNRGFFRNCFCHPRTAPSARATPYHAASSLNGGPGLGLSDVASDTRGLAPNLAARARIR